MPSHVIGRLLLFKTVLFFCASLLALPLGASAQQHIRLDEIGLAFEVPGDWVEADRDFWLPRTAHYSARSADARHLLAIEYYGTLDAASLARVQDVYVRQRIPAGATVEPLTPEELPSPFNQGTRIHKPGCTAYVYTATVGHKGYVVSYIGTGDRHAEATFEQIVASLDFEDLLGRRAGESKSWGVDEGGNGTGGDDQ